MQGARLTSIVPDVVAAHCPNLTTLGLHSCVLAPSTAPLHRTLPSGFPLAGEFAEKHFYLDAGFLQLESFDAAVCPDSPKQHSSSGDIPINVTCDRNAAYKAKTEATASTAITCDDKDVCRKLTHLSIRNMSLESTTLMHLLREYLNQYDPECVFVKDRKRYPALYDHGKGVKDTWDSMQPHARLLVITQMLSERNGFPTNPFVGVDALQLMNACTPDAATTTLQQAYSVGTSSSTLEHDSNLKQQQDKQCVAVDGTSLGVLLKAAAENVALQQCLHDLVKQQQQIWIKRQPGKAKLTPPGTKGQTVDESSSRSNAQAAARMNAATALPQGSTATAADKGGDDDLLPETNMWRIDAMSTQRLCGLDIDEDKLFPQHVEHQLGREVVRWGVYGKKVAPGLVTGVPPQQLSDVLSCLRWLPQRQRIIQAQAQAVKMLLWQMTTDLPRQLQALPALQQIRFYQNESSVNGSLEKAIMQAKRAGTVLRCGERPVAKGGQEHENAGGDLAAAEHGLVHDEGSEHGKGMPVMPQGTITAFSSLTTVWMDVINDACMQQLLALPALKHVAGQFDLNISYAHTPCAWQSIRVTQLRTAKARIVCMTDISPVTQQLALLPVQNLTQPLEIMYWTAAPLYCIISSAEVGMQLDAGMFFDDDDADDFFHVSVERLAVMQRRVDEVSDALENMKRCKPGAKWVPASWSAPDPDPAWAPDVVSSKDPRSASRYQLEADFWQRHREGTGGKSLIPRGMQVFLQHHTGDRLHDLQMAYLSRWLELVSLGGSIEMVSLKVQYALTSSFVSSVYSAISALNTVTTVSFLSCWKCEDSARAALLRDLPSSVASVHLQWRLDGHLDDHVKAVGAGASRPVNIVGVCIDCNSSPQQPRDSQKFEQLFDGNALIGTQVVWSELRTADRQFDHSVVVTEIAQHQIDDA